jgi:hypothetical protein
MKEHEIWIEGYAATGESGTACLVGKYMAESFDDAVKLYMKDHPKINIEWDRYGRGRHANWACEIFNNEADARKHFG